MAWWLFVDPLPEGATTKEVTEVFARFGTVARVIVISRSYQQSRYYGYVEMPIRQEAEQAVIALDGSELLGKSIRVALVERRAHSPRT
jgi:cold-inducible RNA-binding protein